MVRATFAGFGTAFSALQANQKRLDITGQNLANMNTVGYTRQQLQVSSLNYSHPVTSSEIVVGFGVHMESVGQIRDPYLDIQYRNQMYKSGYSNALQTSFDELSNFLDESHITGITDALNDIQSTLLNMQDSPKVNDPVYETELRTRMQALTNLLNDGARQIDAAKANEYSRLDGEGTSEQGAVQRIDDILRRIGQLNRNIKDSQIYHLPCLELQDERNVLLDELASYIPIEVTYYKDKQHDGVKTVDGKEVEALGERYHLNSAGDIIMKKDWPDDLRVTMNYIDGKGVPQSVVLVEGTYGSGEENHASVTISNPDGTDSSDYTDVALQFVNCFKPPVKTGDYGKPEKDITFSAKGNQFAAGSGSVQAGLDMLWKDGSGDNVNNVKGYDYYMNQLDKLAYTFGTVMNTINNNYKGTNGDNTGMLLDGYKNTAASNPTKGAAKNIGISSDWISGDSFVGNDGQNFTDAVMDMLEAMSATYKIDHQFHFIGKDNVYKFDQDPYLDLEGNSFADYMNHVSTTLANQSYSNQYTLKNYVTVLNGIQNSRDSISGVSLDEEASNMMMHMSAYNAASRLMTTLDQALDVLINNTGMVGR